MPSEPAPESKAQPGSFSYSGTELDALAEAKHYYRWIIDQFRPHLGRRVIEIGAGIGTFASALLDQTTVSELVLYEPASNNLPALSARFAGDRRVTVVCGYFGDEAVAPADAIVAVNVLEHIEDDVGVLTTAGATLNTGGALLVFVPALPAIYGTLDVAFGHYRRYTKRSLEAALRAAGFRSVRLRYANLLGVVLWFVAGRVLRRRTLGRAGVALYDRWVVPWIARVEKRWEPPVGQSILAVAKAG